MAEPDRLIGARGDNRSTMARASDARAPRYYDPARNRQEPPAVTAARERHRALNAELETRRAAQAAGGGAMAATKGRWPHADGDGRSQMARASDAAPFKPYVYNGTGEDIYRGAKGYVEDVRRRAVTRREESVPDPAPGPEWYREQAAENEDPPVLELAVPPPVPVPVPPLASPLALSLVPDDGELAELEAARDRYHAAQDALNAAAVLAPPPPVAPAARCGRCGYLTSAAGHRVMCDG